MRHAMRPVISKGQTEFDWSGRAETIFRRIVVVYHTGVRSSTGTLRDIELTQTKQT